jgi:hypothetical protein
MWKILLYGKVPTTSDQKTYKGFLGNTKPKWISIYIQITLFYNVGPCVYFSAGTSVLFRRIIAYCG